MIDPGLKGKVALVTGGNNPYGIGAAIAQVFASQGAAVFFHYFRHDKDIPKDSYAKSDRDKPGLPFYYEQQKKNRG